MERQLVAGTLIILLWCLWRFHLLLLSPKTLSGRKNIVFEEHSIWISRLLTRIQYLWKGPEMLLNVYRTGVPCVIQTPEAYYVHFSSETHIKQLAEASEKHLSLYAISKDMLQQKYTMNGLEVDDRISVNGSVHSRALQFELRSNLGILQQPLSERIALIFTKEMASGSRIAGGWRSIHGFPMTMRLITTANSLVFFGSELSQDQTFLEASLAYPEDLMMTAEALRFTPSFLASFVAHYLMRRHEAPTLFVSRIMPVIEQRLRSARLAGSDTDNLLKSIDCIQFFLDANIRKGTQEPWSAQKIAQVLLGVWFASVHQPAMSLFYALEDLCSNPEYIDQLRAEISNGISEGRDIDSLVLLDSFLRESARLNPSDSISVRRKVLQPFIFKDGTSLMPNEVACVPLQAILRDPNIYSNPLEFDAFRFVDEIANTNTQKFTDSSAQFPLWGLGRRTCPGRYYASVVLKLALAHILLNYDIQMPQGSERSKRRFYWRSAIVPKSEAAFLFRERNFGQSK